MRTVIERWLIETALSFAIRQLAKYGEEVNWETVKEDFAVRVADLVPGTWLDNDAIAISDGLIDAIARAFTNTKTLGIIMELAVEGKYAEAVNKLKDYLLKAWKPVTPSEVKAMSLVELTKYRVA